MECIFTVWGSLPDRDPFGQRFPSLDIDPPDRDPWTETPLNKDPWTGTPSITTTAFVIEESTVEINTYLHCHNTVLNLTDLLIGNFIFYIVFVHLCYLFKILFQVHDSNIKTTKVFATRSRGKGADANENEADENGWWRKTKFGARCHQ